MTGAQHKVKLTFWAEELRFAIDAGAEMLPDGRQFPPSPRTVIEGVSRIAIAQSHVSTEADGCDDTGRRWNEIQPMLIEATAMREAITSQSAHAFARVSGPGAAPYVLRTDEPRCPIAPWCGCGTPCTELPPSDRR